MRDDTGIMRLRAAALVVKNGSILLARHLKDGRVTYLLPGGGVRGMEPAIAALARELREEADCEVSVGPLRYVIETIAPPGGRHLVQLVFEAAIIGEIGRSSDARVLECAWHSIAALRAIPFHPDAGVQIADDVERGVTGLRYHIAPWREPD
ncbi:MAG TPA: NUDIX domain-containing protein [Candidatus Tumulicola sp.]|nr:NUDIX domain-containing protein [Candidatus Tumulicola sp.]